MDGMHADLLGQYSLVDQVPVALRLCAALTRIWIGKQIAEGEQTDLEMCRSLRIVCCHATRNGRLDKPRSSTFGA
jgi:hypothetical protein